MPEQLTGLGRRVLASLPRWAKNERALVKAEGGAKHSTRAYGLPNFVVRLSEDPYIQPPLDADAALAALEELAALGFCEQGDNGWRMTKAGYEALIAPAAETNTTPGAVTIALYPAQLNSSSSEA